MAVEWICDGCGKRAPGETNGVSWFKPALWFERTDSSGEIPRILSVCSRACVDLANDNEKAAGRKSMPIIPL